MSDGLVRELVQQRGHGVVSAVQQQQNDIGEDMEYSLSDHRRTGTKRHCLRPLVERVVAYAARASPCSARGPALPDRRRLPACATWHDCAKSVRAPPRRRRALRRASVCAALTEPLLIGCAARISSSRLSKLIYDLYFLGTTLIHSDESRLALCPNVHNDPTSWPSARPCRPG